MRLLITCFGLFCLVITSFSQSITIIPQPVSIKQPKIIASFSITPSTIIILEGSGLETSAAFLNDYLLKFYGIKLKLAKNSATANAIRLNYERFDNPIEGAYQMTVNNKGVNIAGDNEKGVFYGIQTLIQLLPVQEANYKMRPARLTIPYISIEDAPRFAYRGMHLDVARHFMPVDFIKKYIDYLALHKLNTFHWHLTDDQGWRIEIKKYPRLTEVGAWRNGTIIGRYPGTGSDNKKYGGFYTQKEIKEIVKYATDRYITVIPEIEMPGHASAAIAAYPQLNCFPDEKTVIADNMISKTSTLRQAQGDKKLVQETWGVFEDVFCPSDYTFNFLQDVLDETMALFPSQYIHIGGDECPKEAWKRSAFCQQLIKEKGLKDEHGLQSYFIQRIEKFINSKGRKIIGWDEILEGGLAPNAAVMSWRGEQGGIDAAKQKHEVIMTPGNPVYFDHTQSENEDSVTIGGYNPIEKVYAYEAIPKELNADEAKYVLGAQANLWTEYITNPAKVEYMIFPRMAALSEILWSQKEKRNWSDFEKRLMVQFKRYDLWKANYSKAYFDLKAEVKPTEEYNGIKWVVSSKIEMPSQISFFSKHKLKDRKDTIPVYDPYDPDKIIKYIIRDTLQRKLKTSSSLIDSINIIKTGIYYCSAFKINFDGFESKIDTGFPIINLKEHFNLNKATGKKITLTNPASKNYPGDGAFTLVNAVQNEKGLGKAKEFLGFNGTDCEAIIDLGKTTTISNVVIHCLHQKSSWVWRPQTLEVFSSVDGINFSVLGLTDDFISTSKAGNGTMTVSFSTVETKFIKIKVTNWGEIPSGEPGAGNKPWLFVDEIEVN